MSARILDGRALALALRTAIAHEIIGLDYQPGLVVILVGENSASQVYVRAKDRAAREAGFDAQTIRLPAGTTEADLLETVRSLNDNPAVDGILVQLPLPPQIRAGAVIEAIDPAKDVDGFHPVNAGRLADGAATLAPCTPRAVMKLLAASGCKLPGACALVLGRSSIVGRPVATMLTAADATVTLAHSRTRDLGAECRRADIVVAAIGRPQMIPGEWIAAGATVIDVGINRLADNRLVGDVDYASVSLRAGSITPVPGGVGPMTIACLLENTLAAAKRRRAGSARRPGATPPPP